MPTLIRLLASCTTTICLSAVAAVPAAETITNEMLTVSCDQGQYAVLVRGQTKPFAHGRLRLSGGTVTVVTVKDTEFGQGQAIETVVADGSREILQLFPKLPFVLYAATLANAGKDAVVLNKVPMMDVALDLGVPPSQLKALGTGGLRSAHETIPGFFAWMALADPRTRNGVVGGWLTHEHATGLVFAGADGDKMKMAPRLEYGHLRLDAGKTYATETFMLGWFSDTRLGMEAWADAVAKHLAIKLPPMPVVYCTWYDNVHDGSSNEKYLAELAAFAAKELKPYGFSCVQIDDGWQMGDSKGNGPGKNFSQFNPHGNYPTGMKATADNIRSLGLTAGLWMLPFGGSWNDPFFSPHQEWFATYKENGKPFDNEWGGTTLDMTQAGARDFVSGNIKQASQDWGFKYLKLDGLSVGLGVKSTYANDSWLEDDFGNAAFADSTKTNVDVFRDGLRMVRKAAGLDTFILGCCAPQNMRSYAGVFGLVNAMRMGPDNGGSWSAWMGSAYHGSRNYHLNGRIWWSDPDPIYVRASIPLEGARCIASWNALSGQMISLSDWLPTLPAERLDIIRRVIPNHGVTARPIDLFDTMPARQWLVSDERPDHQRRDVIGLYNWSFKAEDVTLDLAAIGLPPADDYVAFDFWNRVFLTPVKGKLTLTVPGAACRVLAVRPLLPRPFLLSTSRHVAQGIVEVKQETWDERANSLAGISAVVAGDVYELRVVASAPATGWTLAGAEVAAADKAAGVTLATTETNGLIRAVITSTTSRDVAWTLRFTAGKKSAIIPAKFVNAASTIGEDGEDVHMTWTPIDGTTCEVACRGGEGKRDPVLSEIGTCSFMGLTPDQEFIFTLTPITWSGQRGASTDVVVKTPKTRELPPLPPKPTVSITNLKTVESHTGYGKVSIDASMDGKPLTVGGTVYANGIGVHAESLLVYDVKPDYRRFVAVAGIDDEAKNSPASVVFRVIAENGNERTTLASSPRLRGKRGPTMWHFDVAIPDKTRRLRLVVDDAGDGINTDHADWVDAGFIIGER